MADDTGLGAFLKARRAALDPDELGLPAGLNRRRVAGLRREELAQLAGISVDYYTRLEQGRARNVSDAILDALARALRLTPDEERYLRNLAAPPRHRQGPGTRQVRPGLRLLLESMQVPAFVFGRGLDVLAWNPLAAALTFDFASLSGEINMARLFFRHERAREFHPEWDAVAKEVVANLRSEVGRNPDDRRLTQLVGELSVHSAEFRRLWASQAVREKAFGYKLMNNPIVGELRLRYETFRLPGDPDQGLVTYTADPGTESERGLRLLASWVAESPRGVEEPLGDARGRADSTGRPTA
jgi:transcriptional regulator with XRE-family HTH domain